MVVHVALLRAVNVGGHGAVAMGDLRELATSLGLSEARTLLQSGNLLYRTDRRSTRDLETQLESAARKRLGLTTDFMVRTAREWTSVRSSNPFPDEARNDPGRLVTVFLKGAPAPGAEARLREAIRGPERVGVVGCQAYVVYPDGTGRSRLTLAVMENKLGFRGTGRNWNTVTKLGLLSSERAVD